MHQLVESSQCKCDAPMPVQHALVNPSWPNLSPKYHQLDTQDDQLGAGKNQLGIADGQSSAPRDASPFQKNFAFYFEFPALPLFPSHLFFLSGTCSLRSMFACAVIRRGPFFPLSPLPLFSFPLFYFSFIQVSACLLQFN